MLVAAQQQQQQQQQQPGTAQLLSAAAALSAIPTATFTSQTAGIVDTFAISVRLQRVGDRNATSVLYRRCWLICACEGRKVLFTAKRT